MEGVLFCCEVGKVGSRVDGSLSVTLDLPELDGAKVGQVFNLRKKVAYVYISARQIDGNEMKVLDSLDPELKGKTPGQRLRNVLFVAWQQSPDGYKDSESFYKAKMESIINSIKAGSILL